MKVVRRVVIAEDGKLVVEDLPVRKGERVEVVVRTTERVRPTRPLRGLPVRYVDPFLPAVDESEWDTLK